MPSRHTSIDRLPAFDKDEGHLHTVVDTPKGSRNKYKYDEKLGVFALSGLLPVGASFPFDFGFVPSTLGGDGDPLDVLLLMEEPAFVGCLVPTRLIGVIEAEQTERDGSVERNDRLIGVAVKSRLYEEATSLLALSDTLVDEIEHFFVSYNDAKGKVFTPTKRSGPERARSIILDAEKRFKAAHRRKLRR